MGLFNCIKTKLFMVTEVRADMWTAFHNSIFRSWECPEISFPECAGRWSWLNDAKEGMEDTEFIELYNMLLKHRNLNVYEVNMGRASFTKELKADIEEFTKRYREATAECDKYRAQILKYGANNA